MSGLKIVVKLLLFKRILLYIDENFLIVLERVHIWWFFMEIRLTIVKIPRLQFIRRAVFVRFLNSYLFMVSSHCIQLVRTRLRIQSHQFLKKLTLLILLWMPQTLIFIIQELFQSLLGHWLIVISIRVIH